MNCTLLSLPDGRDSMRAFSAAPVIDRENVAKLAAPWLESPALGNAFT